MINKLMLYCLKWLLKYLAKGILLKYRPKLVGITGSIGKTGAKEAIAVVLGRHFKVAASPKNYNNELGVPLTIIGQTAGGSSYWAWLKVLLSAVRLLLWRDRQYPELLILEMGIDHPGDMDYLLSIVKLDAAVLTYIGSSHLENFGSHKKLAEEKMKIFNGLNRGGVAIVNYDCAAVKNHLTEIRNKIVSYGCEAGSDVRAVELSWRCAAADQPAKLNGVMFKLQHGEALVPVHLPSVIGLPSVSAALAAAAVGLAFELNGVEISEALRLWLPSAGRLQLLEGAGGSILIDDTYNAAPQSMLAALEVLDQIRSLGSARKWAILGDMLELGPDDEKGHLEVGKRLAQIPKARLLHLGGKSNYIAIGARKNGLAEERIQGFNNHQEIIDYLLERLEPNDLVLVKGSQGMRMEKIVKGLLANPEDSRRLVRQESNWLLT